MELGTKRIYDAPARADGMRILVDRLWPRGVRKETANVDIWAKDLAPSGTLRSWFHEDPEKRYEAFTEKYRRELKEKKSVARELLRGKKRATLITAARDIERSHVPVLASFLKRLAR